MPPEDLEFLAEWFDTLMARLPADAIPGLFEHCLEGIELGMPPLGSRTPTTIH